MIQPLVSIVCATYNQEKYIAQAIDSFLIQQCNFDFEIIIHDDCSTDGTTNIVRDYEKKHPNIIKSIIQTENIYSKGQKPWVYCFQKARGKYIALCDGDDYWTDSSKLQKQVDFLEKNEKFAGCFHDTLIYEEAEGVLDKKPFRFYENTIFKLEDTLSKVALFHTSSFIFRQSLLEIPEWFTRVQSADMAFFSIIASKGSLYRIDCAMSVYRKNQGGITTLINVRNYHQNRIILFNYLKSYCSKNVRSNINEVVSYHQTELRNLFIRNLKHKTKRFLRL